MFEEWEGQLPQKFRGGKLVDGTRSTQTNFTPGLLGETSNGLERMKGKRHYEQSTEPKVSKWKPSIKTISEPQRAPEKPRRFASLGPIITDKKPRPERKHIQIPPSKEGPYLPNTTKMVRIENGSRVQDLPTNEFDFHKTQMGLKIRVPGLLEKRNSLPMKTAGDKPYKKPEQSLGFYHEGGLVVGSSNVARLKHQGKSVSNNDFATVISYDATSNI
jgi:hypothetical protein